MADDIFTQVITALGEACKAGAPKLNVYTTWPCSVSVPAAVIRIGKPAIRYIQVMGNSTQAKWLFEILLVVGSVNDKAAQKRAMALISPDSKLVAAVNDVKVTEGGAVKVTESSTGEVDVGSGTYASASLFVTADA
jgi:hypothetical protein